MQARYLIQEHCKKSTQNLKINNHKKVMGGMGHESTAKMSKEMSFESYLFIMTI
jgi:hypothetical protein